MNAILALDHGALATMQRDMELIRRIFAEIRAKNDLVPRPVRLDGYDDLQVGRHIQMLIDDGYLEGLVKKQNDKFNPLYCLVTDLSMKGHDFSAALDNESVWNKIKASMSPSELATAPLGIIKDIGLEILTKLIKQQVGLADG
jgi:hypothetical protein